jgi:preprotein translocase subunit SecE
MTCETVRISSAKQSESAGGEGSSVADKEEVEPTEESAAAQSSDAADGLEPTDAEPSDGAESASSGAHAVEPDDFDAIVRGSGIGEDTDRIAEPESTDADPTDADGEKALAPVGAGAVATSGTPGAAARERSARKAKDAATRRRDQPVKVERTGPVKFVRESVGELRKVVYPTGQQLINYFIVVLVFVLFIIAYVSLLDLGLGAAIFKIFS